MIACAKACFVNSDGSFDITSGLLRKVWDFSAAQLPDQAPIDAVLPLIGLDKVTLSSGRLHFWQFAWRRRADKTDNLLRADLGYWVCMFIAGDVVWFALNEDRPLVAFPKSKPVPGPHLVYGFLTTSPNAVVEPIHPRQPSHAISNDQVWIDSSCYIRC